MVLDGRLHCGHKRRHDVDSNPVIIQPNTSVKRRRYYNTKSDLSPTLRRSTRLQDSFKRASENAAGTNRHQLPSPTSSISLKHTLEASRLKRKRTLSTHSHPEHTLCHQQRRKRVLLKPSGPEARDPYHPIKHWIETLHWPQGFHKNGFTMTEPSSGKRKSDSSHRSVYLERYADNGIFMKSSILLQDCSKDLCDELLAGSQKPTRHTAFPPEQFSRVLDRVQNLNEARIQRDILPWVVPSAETLRFCGALELDYIGEEYDAAWDRCATMGGKRPKPDYTVGLLPQAFTKGEREKLKNYSTPDRPFLFTPELCFPFLMCEVKAGERGMNEADRQNIHSASIAVKGIIELFKAAFGQSASGRVKDLYGQILVFTVSHDNDRVCLFGHFAVPGEDPNQLEFYRYPIEMISLGKRDGVDRHKAYNFVRNIYDKFATQHWKRIKDATAGLPTPGERTDLSFGASELGLEEMNSQQSSQDVPASEDDTVFKAPGLPASALEMEKLRAENREQRERMEKQNDRLLQQMERQRQQMERQRQDSKEQIERLLQEIRST